MAQYNRQAAVEYAHKWAFSRSPRYLDFESFGGDCTNFCSQCLYAGAKVMDYKNTFGWYYISAYNRAPAWSGVEFLYNYLTRKSATPGPKGVETTIDNIRPGDIVQLEFDTGRFSHSPVIVSIGSGKRTLDNVLIAAHSEDSDNRALSTYEFKSIRFIQIIDFVKT